MNDHLYLIGGNHGGGLDSIISIDVSDPQTIMSQSWTSVGVLQRPVYPPMTVVIRDSIFVLGGWISGVGGSDDVHKINGGVVTTVTSLPFATWHVCFCYTGTDLFVFPHTGSVVWRAGSEITMNSPTDSPSAPPTTGTPSQPPSDSPTWLGWKTISVPTLPIDHNRMCGYNADTRKLFILGGNTNPDGFSEYDIASGILTVHSDISTPVTLKFEGQGYAAFGDSIYFVSEWQLGRFNMTTSTVHWPISSVTFSACGQRASLAVSDDGKYFFAVGGCTGSCWDWWACEVSLITSVEIYDVDADAIIPGPSGNVSERMASAIAINGDFLYIIGGWSRSDEAAGTYGLDSIEAIDISNPSAIGSEVWQFTDNPLSQKGSGSRAVARNGSIYIFGGAFSGGASSFDDVERIDGSGTSVQVTSMTPMSSTDHQGCAVKVGQSVYMVSGQNAEIYAIADL